jgi:hypothetical protein
MSVGIPILTLKVVARRKFYQRSDGGGGLDLSLAQPYAKDPYPAICAPLPSFTELSAARTRGSAATLYCRN